MKNPWMENRDRFEEESLDGKNRDRFGLKIGTVLTRNPWMESRDRFNEESLDGQ